MLTATFFSSFSCLSTQEAPHDAIVSREKLSSFVAFDMDVICKSRTWGFCESNTEARPAV